MEAKDERITELEDALMINKQNNDIQRTRIKQLEDDVAALKKMLERQVSVQPAPAPTPAVPRGAPVSAPVSAVKSVPPSAVPMHHRSGVQREPAVEKKTVVLQERGASMRAGGSDPRMQRVQSTDSLVRGLRQQLAQAQEAIVASVGDPFEEAVQCAVEQVFDRSSPPRERQTFAEKLAIAALAKDRALPTARHYNQPVAYPLSPWRERHQPQRLQPTYYLPCTGMGF
eukprot:TRINITY_DN20627_c0_g1_i1.p1 TRINITY_DN20627_c0_g1~~TRINITY_DN20627_c0_g1_i1.p1  ORF type:complete len:253 (+),score=84.05 TRINITY_DN20627_c0_g1_i1:76-759(+)